IHADDMETAGKILAGLVRETIARTESADHMEFTELKCGVYPDDAPEELRGKTIKWTAEEVAAGTKTIRDEATNTEYSVSLEKASENPGSMVKLDWLVVMDGQVKELTKVINVEVVNGDGDTPFSNRLKPSAFQ